MKITTQDTIATAGRLLIGLLFLLSGIHKASDPSGTIGYIASQGVLFPELAYAAALLVELGLIALFVVGYKTRWTSLLLAAFTLATALVFHRQLGDQGEFIQFFKNLSIVGGMLQVQVFGAGALSIDGWIAAKRAQRAA